MKKILLRVLLILGIIVILIIGYGLITYNQFSTVSQGEPIPEYSTPGSALLVIDIQEGTTGTYSTVPHYKNQADSLITTINTLINKADQKNIPVIYIYHQNSNILHNFISGGKMKKGSPGTKIDSRVHIVTDLLFPKHKMDAFSNPQLDTYLRNKHIDHLYITGLDAVFCVDRTVRAALNRNYKVTYITDAVICYSYEKKQQILDTYRDMNIGLAKSSQVINNTLYK